MASPRRLLRLIPLLLGLFLVVGCGKRGALIPPEALAPAPVNDLAVAQKGGRFEVSWSAPSRQDVGAPLTDLAGFQLFRRLVLPPPQDCEECPGAYFQVARVDLEYLQGARRIGNRYFVDDAALREGSTYQYKVHSFTRKGALSRESNFARRKAVTPPLPPVLEATSSATAVALNFVTLPPPGGRLVGYNLYRSKVRDEASKAAVTEAAKAAVAEAAEAMADTMPRTPLNAASITATTYEDTDVVFGERYSYTVIAIAEVSGETVESAPSNQVEGALLGRD